MVKSKLYGLVQALWSSLSRMAKIKPIVKLEVRLPICIVRLGLDHEASAVYATSRADLPLF